MKILAEIHISYDRYFSIWTQILQFTYVFAVASATLKLFVNKNIFTKIHTVCHSIDTRVRIWTPAVQTYMLLPLRVFTLRTPFVYINIIRSVHIFYRRYVCIWTDVVQTYVCVCPCESWHLEPFVYRHIFTSIHVSYYRYSCIWAPVVQLACVCALARAHT